MATEAQQDRFRADLGDADESAFSDAVIDDIFTCAIADAIIADDALIFVDAKIIGVRQLIAQAVKRVDYTKGESSAKLSQRVKGLRDMLKDFQGERTSLLKSLSSPIRQLGVRKKPRNKSIP